jgi:D-alanine-D-alanine ligase
MQLDRGVVVLHNTPSPFAGWSDYRWPESNCGVMCEVERVVDDLRQIGIPCRQVGISQLADLYPALAGQAESIVLNLVDGLAGGGPLDYTRVPAVVQSLGLACTGADSACLGLCADKWQTKAALLPYGVPTPQAVVVPLGQDTPGLMSATDRLIVKPLRAHASEGIDASSVVFGRGPELVRAVKRVHQQFGSPALIEQFIDGRELGVSILQHGRELHVLPLAEIDFSGLPPDMPHIVCYAAKWLPETPQARGTQRRMPADLPDRIAEHVRRLALAAWEATACSGYARVDFRLDPDGQPFVLEVNPNPDMGPDSSFAAALETAGIAHTQFAQMLVDDAIEAVQVAGDEANIA